MYVAIVLLYSKDGRIPLKAVGPFDSDEEAKNWVPEGEGYQVFPLEKPIFKPLVQKPELEWNGIKESERKLWFGVAVKGMTAPWMSGFGACFVKIWDIRRRLDGVIEYGIGNEKEPPAEQIGWITADRFYSEWPN